MKKNFVKKLALGLALVMTVGSVNMPVAAEAASEPGFKSTAVKVKVGQTKKYNTNHYGKWSVKKFVIGNKKVATISYSKGSKAVKVTGVAEGTTRLRADFKAYKSKREVSARIPVTVVKAEEVVTTAELASVKQTAANAFEATFTADASQTITAESFTNIESADGIYSAYVKSVEFSADGKTALVTTYGNFVDKAVYNVTCAEKVASFTASVGAVATAVITTVQAQANVETDIEFKLYDANNIDVTNAVALDTYVTLDVEGDYSSANLDSSSDATITLDTVGNTATITLTYDALDGSTPVTTKGTITCVATQATVGKTTYFTLSDETPKIYLNSFAADTTLYDEDMEEDFYFTALDKNGDAIEYESYEIESTNENIITVSDNLSSDEKYAQFTVTTQGTGTAKVVIKATKNEVETVYSGTVVVKAERKLTSISLSKASLTVGNNEANDNDKVTVILNDQYGGSMDEATWTAEQYNGNGEVTPTTNGYSYDSVKVTANGADAGSYVIKVEATDDDKTLTKRFSVTVRDVKDTATSNYKVELNKTSIDLNPEALVDNYNVTGTVKAKVALYKGTVFSKYVDTSDLADLKVYVKKGSKYFNVADLSDKDNMAATKAAITLTNKTASLNTVNVSGSAIDLKAGDGIAEVGTYSVIAESTFGGEKTVTKTATFTVKNTMEMPAVTVESTTGEGTGSDLVKDCIKVDVDVLASEDASIVDVLDKDYASVANTDKVVTKYVKVSDSFTNGAGTYTFSYYVPVSKTFKTK